MMHYGSWINPQNVLDNHRCYTQYIEESYRLRNDIRDEESEQTGDETHDTITTATSGERSSSADLFRLEFAATQWSKLVSNAEGLFNKLMASNILPHNEQDQVEQWLCMKQEYEECITNDENASLTGFTENNRRSLERIEEVTETDEKTDESANPEFRNVSESCTSTESEMSEDNEDEEDDDEEEEEDEQSDVSSENPDFLEKLDECMKKFKFETDQMIEKIDNEFMETNLPVISSGQFLGSNINEPVPILKPIPIRNANTRRNSMLPGSEMCNEILAFNNGFKPCRISELQDVQDNSEEVAEEKINDGRQALVLNGNRGQKDNSPDILVDALKSNDVSEPIKTLKTLTMNNEAKQTQVKMIESDLDEAHKRIEELQMTIKIKEQFIASMIKNSELRGAKQKLRKRLKVKKEFFSGKNQSFDEKNHQREIELCKNIAIHYEQRLMDIERIRQIAGDSSKKVLELEMSLNASKKQMEKLQKQLKKEEERKTQLEAELAEDQKKIKELEEKYNLTESKLQEMRSESEDERANSRARSDQEKNNLLLMNSKISQIDYLSFDKLEGDGKMSLRREIENLRRTKDRLVEQKCDLDEKLQKEKTLTNYEERRRLECGETIEMIDAMIEHKNEMICGRQKYEKGKNPRESSEKIIIDKHLSKLSEQEMRQLFYTYFRKVIDLKESSRTLEVQAATQEAVVENQKTHIRTLTNVLKHMQMEAERRIVIQKEYEEELFMFRNFANETGSSSHEKLDKGSENERKLKKENKTLRKKLEYYETLFRGSNAARTTSPPRIPHQELKQIAPPPKKTTKVTIQKNKLIIQKTDCDKRK
ncbi:kinesin-like protein costa [Chelonus insularis]|uniref:kinesin-like protein costa n=1 Tax=Chelonus insularis TaxID=460826 RepID=UPI00158D5BD1|nr:kinesin-like protein costa [Chelonus insularis]